MKLHLPAEVSIGEIVVRDGFQHEEQFIPTATKVLLVNALVEAGFKRIEVSNFANPKRQPQFRDRDEVFKSIVRRPDVEYTGVTVVGRGVEDAVKMKQAGYGPDRILCMISTSEPHNLRNTGLTHAEHWPLIEKWTRLAHENGMKMCVTISTIWGCPIQGPVPMQRAVEFTDRALSLGADDIEHADHDGQGTPDRVYEYFSEVMKRHPDPELHVAHFHVTRGWGLANILASLQAGITRLESALGGIGGQPANFVDKVPVGGTGEYYYADPGITGLVATEDLVVMLDEMGIRTGVNVDKVLELGRLVEKVVGRRLRSECVATGRIPKRPTGR